jgi:hypothetical protein
MGQVVQSTGQEFWRSPTVLDPPVESVLPAAVQYTYTNEACAECATEFMVGAHFCHACGLPRPTTVHANGDAAPAVGPWARNSAWIRLRAARLPASVRKISFPAWLRYLHFHEIKQAVGLPTVALIAFIMGLGCVFGAVAVGLIYRASNLAEFQAIQMWRMEWLLAATAAFVCGILLKKPSKDDSD